MRRYRAYGLRVVASDPDHPWDVLYHVPLEVDPAVPLAYEPCMDAVGRACRRAESLAADLEAGGARREWALRAMGR